MGHSIAAYSLASAARYQPEPASLRHVWAGWLLVLACAPDANYLIPVLHSRAHDGLRITHSVAFSLVLPLCTAVILCLAGGDGRKLKSLTACAALAGLSHLVLDSLLGVTPLPLLWPFSAATFASPTGILPSARRIDFSSPHFLGCVTH